VPEVEEDGKTEEYGISRRWHFESDQTAWRLGRVSFNPVKHIDPFGTILLPGLLLLMRSPFLFGYAKPVPVNFRGLRQSAARYSVGRSGRPGHKYRTGVSCGGRVSCCGLPAQHRRGMGGGEPKKMHSSSTWCSPYSTCFHCHPWTAGASLSGCSPRCSPRDGIRESKCRYTQGAPGKAAFA